VGKKKVRKKVKTFLRTFSGLQSLYLSGRSSDLRITLWLHLPIPYRITGMATVAYSSHRPRLQRWPNVTDLHRIPFSSPLKMTPESYFLHLK
jgi:hypothetical protein